MRRRAGEVPAIRLVRKTLNTPSFTHGPKCALAQKRDFMQCNSLATEINHNRGDNTHLHDFMQFADMAKRKLGKTPETIYEGANSATTAKKAKPEISERRSTSKTLLPNEELVKRTNAMKTEDFRSFYVGDHWLHPTVKKKGLCEPFDISLVAADFLSPGEHNATFSIVEMTSRNDYESNGTGWHPRSKRKEMLDPEMRYLLVRRKNAKPVSEQRNGLITDTSVEGYISFLITHDSVPSVPVLYIYEIHLMESLRGVGLGAHLMATVEDVAEKVGVQQIMLTCFLSNSKAFSFYQQRGYRKDASSPNDRMTRNKVVKAKYQIMSKPTGHNLSEPSFHANGETILESIH